MAESKSSLSETRLPSVEKGEGTVTGDDAFLATLGYKQEFKREFSKLELFGVSFSIIGVLPSIASVSRMDVWYIVMITYLSSGLSSYSQFPMEEPQLWFGVYVSLPQCILVSRLITHSQWAACAFLIVFIALAMGELGSAMPTSGGLYYWTFSFSSPRWRCLLSWLVGCKLKLYLTGLFS